MSKLTASEQDGIQYRRAKTWHIAVSQMYCMAGMCFYMLMTYATYIGNSNFGIVVAVTGVIMTVSRVFDSITDPICAFIVERFNSKFGKVRIFMMAGWAVMSLATTMMCNWGAGHLSGFGGLVFFIVCYFVYILGYTLQGVSTNMVGNLLTNDPRQRPVISVWGTIFSYLTPTALSMVSMMMILPKHDNLIETPFLAELNIFIVVLSGIFYLCSCIGITPYDKPEFFEGISTGNNEEQKVSFKDMANFVKSNKEFQYLIIAASSDKLAQTIGSASVISTMLFGILIGNMSISSVLSAVAMLPSIIFAVLGARLAGKHGNRKVMIDWTWVCIGLNVLFAAFMLFGNTTAITVAAVPTAIFMLLTLGNSSVKMVVSTATSALRMDVVDYELYRSGNYLPATVAAAYSFIDKLISSFGSTIATLMIGLIGYTTVAPQPGDPLTAGVRIMTVFMYCGFPIIGWIFTLIAMKKSKLTREKMVEVQKDIAAKKAAALEATAE